MLRNVTPFRKSAPWPPNISAEDASCTAPATKKASVQILFKCPTPAIVFENATKPTRLSHFWQSVESTAPATQNDVSTSKSGTNMWCFYHVDLEMRFAPQRRALFRHLNFQKCSEHEVLYTFSLGNVLRATAPCTFSTSQLPKVLRTWGVFYIFTWKCASRHNAAYFSNISISKIPPNMLCFVHFYLQMCFAPQRRALFQHLNFQKRSDAEVFCTFSLQNLLRATTACNFSSLISTDVSAPAALASYFSTLRSHKTSKKHSVSRLSCLFAHLHLLLSNLFSSDSCPFWLFSPLLFHLSILSEV